MKIKQACEVCGKRAKTFAIKKGFNLCMKHYNIRVKETDVKDGRV